MQDSGISTIQIHYRACHDGMGRLDKVTAEERDVACKKFKEATGVSVEPHLDAASYIIPVTSSAILVLVIGIIIGYAIGKRKTSKKTKSKPKR